MAHFCTSQPCPICHPPKQFVAPEQMTWTEPKPPVYTFEIWGNSSPEPLVVKRECLVCFNIFDFPAGERLPVCSKCLSEPSLVDAAIELEVKDFATVDDYRHSANLPPHPDKEFGQQKCMVVNSVRVPRMPLTARSLIRNEWSIATVAQVALDWFTRRLFPFGVEVGVEVFGESVTIGAGIGHNGTRYTAIKVRHFSEIKSAEDRDEIAVALMRMLWEQVAAASENVTVAGTEHTGTFRIADEQADEPIEVKACPQQ